MGPEIKKGWVLMVNKIQTLICGIMFAMDDVSILEKKKKNISKHPYIV